MKPEWAKNLVTAFARVGGQPVGIVANQPMVLGGALDVNAADKAARFVWLCDAFNIPLVFLHDVPGFIVGSAVEKQGIIRHGAKMLFAVSRGDRAEDQRRPAQELRRGLLRDERHSPTRPTTSSIWPTAEIAVMGPDGVVNIIMRKQLEAIPEGKERDAARIAMAEEIRKNIDPYIAAGHAQVDDVIDPAETRARDLEGPAGLSATSASIARGASTACCLCRPVQALAQGRLRTPTSSVSMIRRGASLRRGNANARFGSRTWRLPASTAATTSSATCSFGMSTSSCSL